MQGFPPNSNLHQSKTNNEQKYSQSMQKMFRQIDKIITHLIKNLAYIYQAHGIANNISHYHSILMKMLMPAQLVSFVHFWCPNGSFKDEALSIMQPQMKIIKQQFSKRDESVKINIKQGRNQSQKSLYYENKDPLLPSLSIYEDEPLNDYNKFTQLNQQKNNIEISYPYTHNNLYNQPVNPQKQYKNKMADLFEHGKKPLIDNQIQKALSQWILQQLKSGRRVKKVDIARQRMRYSDKMNTQGSYAWCNRFLIRNPNIRQLLLRQKKNKDLQVLKYSIGQDSLQSDYKNLQTQNQMLIQEQQQVRPRGRSRPSKRMLQLRQKQLHVQNQRERRRNQYKMQLQKYKQFQQKNVSESQDGNKFLNEVKFPRKVDVKSKYFSDSYRGSNPQQYDPWQRVQITQKYYEQEYEQIPVQNQQLQNQYRQKLEKAQQRQAILAANSNSDNISTVRYNGESALAKTITKEDEQSKKSYMEIQERIKSKMYGSFL